MILPRSEFETEARALCQCLSRIATTSPHDDKYQTSADPVTFSGSFPLVKWEIDELDPSMIYLKHPPIIIMQVQSRGSPGDMGSLGFEDLSIPVDDEQYEAPESTSSMTWHFSAVYSETYQVPILYFYVHRDDGSTCTRFEILERLAADQDKSVQDSWDFVSQEPHPVTGFPSYFLHPCRTQDRMKLMLDTERDLNTLWAWMAMIMPAVNQSIPAKVYVDVQRALQNEKRKKLDSM